MDVDDVYLAAIAQGRAAFARADAAGEIPPPTDEALDLLRRLNVPPAPTRTPS